MLSSLLASIASGEASYALRRARLAALAYGLAAIFLACGAGFLIGAAYIHFAAIYGSLNAALGFGIGFIVLALLVLLVFKLGTGRRIRRQAALRQSELSAIAAASCVALA